MSGRQLGGPEINVHTVSVGCCNVTVREATWPFGKSIPITMTKSARPTIIRTGIKAHFIGSSFFSFLVKPAVSLAGEKPGPEAGVLAAPAAALWARAVPARF